MPKRKRDEQTQDNSERDGVQGRAVGSKRIEEKLHHHQTLIFRALRTAKGFERQKLGRRRKTALKTRTADVERIDAEIEALKALDLNTTAEDYFFKIIHKDKQLSDNEALQCYIAAHTVRSQTQGPAANVTARLYSSNPIKEVVKDVLATLRHTLGIRLDQNESRSQGRGVNLEKEGPAGLSGRKKNRVEVNSPEPNIEADDENTDEEQGGGYSHLFASASEDESIDVEKLRAVMQDDALDEQSLSSSTESRHDTIVKVRSIQKKQAPSVATSTTFLPSLSMGGYWSGSESEPEDDIDDVAPRKNRRGQRARRQIWEQKFGHKAKHLQDTEAAGSTGRREDGWDAQREAQNTTHDGARNGRAARRAAPAFASGGNAIVVAPRKSVSANPLAASKQNGKIPDEKLHPSWIAAKKAKNERQTAAFTGSRVTFT